MFLLSEKTFFDFSFKRKRPQDEETEPNVQVSEPERLQSVVSSDSHHSDNDTAAETDKIPSLCSSPAWGEAEGTV